MPTGLFYDRRKPTQKELLIARYRAVAQAKQRDAKKRRKS